MPHVLRADGTFAKMEDTLAADLERVRSYESIERCLIDGGRIFQDTYYYNVRCDGQRTSFHSVLYHYPYCFDFATVTDLRRGQAHPQCLRYRHENVSYPTK